MLGANPGERSASAVIAWRTTIETGKVPLSCCGTIAVHSSRGVSVSRRGTLAMGRTAYPKHDHHRNRASGPFQSGDGGRISYGLRRWGAVPIVLRWLRRAGSSSGRITPSQGTRVIRGTGASCYAWTRRTAVCVGNWSCRASAATTTSIGREWAFVPVSYTHLTLPTKRIV